MDKVRIRLPGTEHRGYSTSKVYDNKGIYISLGGDVRPGGSSVAIINDEYVEIVLYDDHAATVIEDYKKSQETKLKLDAWAKRCVKKMYTLGLKTPGMVMLVKQIAETSYKRGFSDGDEDRRHKIMRAIGG